MINIFAFFKRDVVGLCLIFFAKKMNISSFIERVACKSTFLPLTILVYFHSGLPELVTELLLFRPFKEPFEEKKTIVALRKKFNKKNR